MKTFKQTVLVVVAVAIGLLAHTAQSVGQVRSNKKPETQSIELHMPLKRRFNTIILPIVVNGMNDVQCILDTGMPAGLLLFNQATAERCKIKYLGSVNVQGAGTGQQTAKFANDTRLSLESLQWTDQPTYVLAAPGSLAHLGVDGAIGHSMFGNHVVVVDFDQAQISVYSPDEFDASDFGDPIELEIVNTKLFIEATVNVSGEDETLKFLLDTGANRGLSINPSSSKQRTPLDPIQDTYLGSGVGGDIVGSLGRIRSLRLGQHELRDVTAGFPDQPGIDQDGTIGMQILDRFRVAFDVPNRRIFLMPNSRFHDKFEFTMTGLAAKPDDQGRLTVHDVIPGSPADNSKLQAGDIIVSVNGEDASFLTYTDATDHLREPGKTLNLVLEREGKRFSTSLTTRRLR